MKTSIKRSGFVMYSDLKYSTFAAVKNTRYVKGFKGVPFVPKRLPFIPQMVFKGERSGTSERILSV